MAFEIPADFVSTLRPSISVSEPRQNPIGNTFLNWWTDEDIAPEMQARAHSYSGYISHQQKVIAEDELPAGKCIATSEQEATSTRIGSKTAPRKFEMTLKITAEGHEGEPMTPTDTPTTRCSTNWDDNEGSVVDDNDLGDNPTSKGEATTLMLRNLPEQIVQQDLIDALNAAGFAGQVDFCYMPSIFATGLGKGYAFINFVSSDMAKALRSAWEGRSPLGKSSKGRVRTSLAHIQGRDANIRKWNTRKTMRIRNPNHRPFVPGLTDVSS
jgi:hypothetical protein